MCNRNIENSLYKFSSIAKQKDLKYQIHNNAEFDNGIINSENESYQGNLNLCKEVIYSHYYNENLSVNSQSSINENKEVNIKHSNDEIDIDICEKIHNNTIGYKIDYLIEYLQNKKINYATTTYYLMLKSKT